ncbi:hypothetical protein [Asticcacaulis sp. YBE204]|uniref:hypothetical protein n=1 Tax=Asticcacaulis sp. YBE204 TaxID=1282363 RepID=UPI0003C3E4BC|nr:hypothetical protein [Asticcacaulis sp. YBE204]ESQ78483.1 hypothetical protein AEYBE204_13090 [Asticcacaulis sp. YBE204]
MRKARQYVRSTGPGTFEVCRAPRRLIHQPLFWVAVVMIVGSALGLARFQGWL